MKHDISLDAGSFRLRPLELSDAEFIVQLRTDPIRSRFLHATSPNIEDQIAWTKLYFDRPNDWYFIVESCNGLPHGAISIYNTDVVLGEAEWGRWILREGSLAALASAFMIYDIGFHILEVRELYTHTETENKKVVSFHASMGSIMHGTLVGPHGENWTEQRMTNLLWEKRRAEIKEKVEAIGRMAARP